ncbi:MAG: hypothetical protein ACUVXB_05620 [Bryobacteraceae bacterium]
MKKGSLLLVCVLAALAVASGPVEFGRQEVEKALAERRIAAAKMKIQSEVSPEPPETYRILPGRVTGGDLRGLMYGLLEAAEQIRGGGKLRATSGRPALGVRSLRIDVRAKDANEEWLSSGEFWQRWFASMARARFNRLTLLLEDLPQEQALQYVPAISRVGADYAMELAIGFRLRGLRTRGGPGSEAAGPSALLAIKSLLIVSPAVRTVQIWMSGEKTDTEERMFFEEWVLRALRETGRRVTLEIIGNAVGQELVEAARNSGIPIRAGTRYRAKRPPAVAGSPPVEVIWQVATAGVSGATAVQRDAYIRRVVEECAAAGCSGFEVEVVDSPAGPQMEGYESWGRLGYNPKAAGAAGLRQKGGR